MTAKWNLIEKLDVNERYFWEIIYDNWDWIIWWEYRNWEKLVEKINEIIDYLTQPPTSPAVKGVDEFINRRWAKLFDYSLQESIRDEMLDDLKKALKQTSVASECKHEYPDWDIKYPCCLCGKIEKPITEEIIKDSQLKEVDIKDKKEKIYFKCDCCQRIYRWENYCKDCWAKIKWIA